MMKHRIAFLFCCLSLAVSLSAQPGQPTRQGDPKGGFPFNLVYYEAFDTPSQTPGFSRVDILYRIDMSFFIAVRDPSNPLFSDFIRKGEVQIELMDSTGMTASRKIQRFEVPAKGTEAKPGTIWHLGQVSMDLVPADYTIAFTIEDRESERSVSERTRRVTARDFTPTRTAISSPVFVKPSERGDSLFFPVSFGGGIQFGQPATLVVQVTNSNQDSPPAHFSITTTGRGAGKDSVVAHADHEPPTALSGFLVPMTDGDTPAYRITRTSETGSVIVFPFPAAKLSPGLHSMTITAAAETLMHQFSVVWPDMPKSLQNSAYAFDALRFITTADELDSLESGSEEERMSHFENFWASKDGTPGTAFNEVMVEYYSRVDHAAITFGTLREPDGTRTDRGRIHVLYGVPTRVERNLAPSGFIETWSYENARKRFIFLDETKTGNYVLTSTRPL